MKRVVLIFSLWLALGLCFCIVHLDINGYYGTNAPDPLEIESYVEDNDEVVHPDVIYFENGWNGYAYWMAFTPFANSNAQFENPSIAVSHDGLEWVTPSGLTNPVVAPFAETYNPNDYYHSDPDIIMSDDNSTMYLFWREHSGWRFETLKYVSSTDGVNWSEPVSVLQVDGSSVERIISPAIVRDSENYKMWTVNTKTTPRTINMRTSDNLSDNWSEPVVTDLPMITPNSEIWHLDVVCVDDKYYMLASVGAAGTPRGGDLYLALSENGINWEVSATPALSGNDNSWDKLLYRSTFIANPVNNHLNFKVWYSCDGGTATDNLYWKIGYTEFTHPDTPTNNLDAEATAPITSLINNYPNPFNPETTISFNLKDSGDVRLEIYNIKGQKIRTLLNEHQEAGNHNIVWNGTDEQNRKVASGVYLYKMRSGKFSSTKKMILLK